MKITKVEALQRTIELWEWLAQTGNETKWDWPGWGKYQRVENNCFLCQFAERCALCPLYRHWGRATLCTDNNSPYFLWEDTNSKKERQRQASRVVKLCKNALRREDYTKN